MEARIFGRSSASCCGVQIGQACVQNRCAGEEVICVTLVDDEETNLIAHARRAAEHHLFGLAQRFAR